MQRVIARFSIAFLLFSTNVTLAQENQAPLILQHLGGPIELDGMSDEPAWQVITPLPLTMHLPTFGKAPSERTEIRIAYDNDNLYVAARNFDAEPARVQGNSLKRDVWSASDDQLALILDTFNDNQNALTFITTPAGKRVDFTIVNDGVDRGASSTDQSWNTYWDVAVQRSDQGWFAEMRIPFSSLRFQPADGRVVMGLIVWRWIARKNEFDTYPPIPPNWEDAYLKPSVAKDIVLENLVHHDPVYVTPYALGGVNQNSSLNVTRGTYDRIDKSSHEVGADVKYNVTSNLTLDLSANTDFAQAEADDQQINLTRFSLFFPEKRQFFLERANIFDFNTGGSTRLFYSRRIGLSDDGRPIRIYGGTRLVGTVGDWDIGFLDMQTARFETQPVENSGVFRARRRIFNENSTAGGMVTTKLGEGGRHNVALGLDGIIQMFGQDFLYVNLAQTVEDSVKMRGVQSGLMRIWWERNATVGIGYGANFIRAGRSFTPGLGFKIRDDYTLTGGKISYGWIPSESSSFQTHLLTLDHSYIFRNADGSTELADVGLTWNGNTKYGAFVVAGLRATHEDLHAPFAISSSAHVPAGRFTYYVVNASYRLWGKLLVGTVTASAGSFYDGSQLSLGVTPAWSVSPYLQLSGEYQFKRIRFTDRNEAFDGHVARLRVAVSLNTSFSINTFLQWSNARNLASLNMQLRYNFREGNDFYIVYNEGLNTARDRAQPPLPSTDSRTVLAKYTYTFQF
jgi:hypothetical protein